MPISLMRRITPATRRGALERTTIRLPARFRFCKASTAPGMGDRPS